MKIIRRALLWMVIVLPAGFAHAEDLHKIAEKQAKNDDITGMASTYQKILVTDPGNTKARLGYATALSWQGKYKVAQKHFSIVLKKQPENLDALVGLGYNFAWNNQFDLAEKQFKKALNVAPENIGAKKGLGFTYLWSNRPAKALEIFQELQKRFPDDPEILAALGQAQLALNKNDDAEISFQRALTLAPGRPDVVTGLEQINQGKRVYEFIAWVGDTSDGGRSGLRELIAAYWLKSDTRVWVRYDNSLSLDNPSLARSGEKAETYYLGLLTSMKDKWQGVFEIGTRDLPNNADQQIYKIEAIQINDSDVFKLGGQLSPHSDSYTDTLVYSTYGFPVNSQWRLEPGLFISSTGQADDKEWRAVIFTEYASPKRWNLGMSVGGGRINTNVPATEGGVYTASTQLSYPIGQKNRLNFSVRYEKSPTISFTTVLAGVAIFLP